MIDALGTPQSLLLLGGTSDIALAVAERYLENRPLRVVLAARPSPRLTAAAARLTAAGAQVETLAFDAAEPATHEAVLDAAFTDGDIDVTVVAFGVLGDPPVAEPDPQSAVRLAQVNYVGAVSVGIGLSRRLRLQGHGAIVALSSVAAQRPRRSIYLYGSSKAGMDSFYRGLADALAGSGVRVVVVRPGQVSTKMTAHLPSRPLQTTPQQVAVAVTEAVWRGRPVVWVPGRLRWVMVALRLVPGPVFRRLPL